MEPYWCWIKNAAKFLIMKDKVQQLSQLFLRIATGIAYFIYGTDRLGLWGKPGGKNISWGDWQHFMEYAKQVMSFLPDAVIPVFAATATVAEIILGILLMAGYKTKYAAFGSGLLSFLFALSMTISFGFLSPLGYGVFTVCAASFLLCTIDKYNFSIDQWIRK